MHKAAQNNPAKLKGNKWATCTMNFNGTLCRQDNSQQDSEILHIETLGSKNKFHLLMQWTIPQYHTGGDCRAIEQGHMEQPERLGSTLGRRAGIIQDEVWGSLKHRDLCCSFSLELSPQLEEIFIQLGLKAE